MKSLRSSIDSHVSLLHLIVTKYRNDKALRVVDGKLHLRPNYSTVLNRKGMLSKGSGLTGGQMPSMRPGLPKLPLPGGINSAAVNIIFLDMTWHETEYWIQARDAIRDLYPDLRGAVHLAPVGISRKVALISNKETFFTRTLPMLNQRAFNPSMLLNESERHLQILFRSSILS